MSKLGSKKKIIIGVMTCPRYAHRSAACRETWVEALRHDIKVLFVEGKPGVPEQQLGDRLYVDCVEAYENLPEKVIRFFCYCQNHFEFDYILKLDDDSYLDVNRFLEFDTQNGDYIGLFKGIGDPHITRTWHYGKCEDKSLEVPYQGKYVCDWARGGGYLLSRKAVSILVEKTADTFKDHLFEDKMVGEALTLDDRIKTMQAHYVDMGILNPMPPHNMKFVHEQLAPQAPAQPRPKSSDTSVNAIDFGSFRRLEPISRKWGFDRGKPVDRYYIEDFLHRHSELIQGSVMEIKDASYSRRFGSGRIETIEVLDINPNNPDATLIADICDRDPLPEKAFDCIVFTQTLQLIKDPQIAIENLHYMLKPGGSLLLTAPGISKIQNRGAENTWFYFFTLLSLQELACGPFDSTNIQLEAFGNVFVASAFLWGLSLEDLGDMNLDHKDPDYPLIITLAATRKHEAMGPDQ